MQIYVFKSNQKTGPFTLDVIQANLKGGVFAPTDLCWYDGMANWSPLSTLPDCSPAQETAPSALPPIPTAPPQPSTPPAQPVVPAFAKVKPDESLGTVLVMLPLVAGALTWFWIGNMRLIDGPGAKLGLLTVATILITGVVATIEASKLGIGSDSDVAAWSQRGSGKSFSLKPPTPIVWFFGFALMWILSYPSYLYYRSRYGLRNLIWAGFVSLVIWLIPLTIVGYAVVTAQEQLDTQIKVLQN